MHRRMWVRSFSTRLTSVTFAEDKVLIAMGILSVRLSVRPSVCPSVKRVHCDKTEESYV